MNRPREAIRILSALDPARGELRGDPYYWWALTLAQHQLGEHARELRSARRARALIPGHPVVAVTEIRALAALGREADVRRRLDEALASPSRLSPPPAMLFQHAVLELGAHGRRAAARALAGRAVAWHHARPPQEQVTDAHRRSLAQALYHAERWEEARVLLAALATSHPDDVTIQGQLGVVAARQDRDADARRIAAWLATVDQPYAWAAPVSWRAGIAAQLGEPEAALMLLRESVTRGRLREGIHNDPALEPLRALPAFRALLRPQG